MTHHDLPSARSLRRALLALVVVAGGLSLAVPAAAATLSTGGPYAGAEGQHVAIQGTASGAASYRWSVRRVPGNQQERARCSFGDAASLSTQVWCRDDGIFDLKLTASDGASSTTRLTLTNVAPALTRVTPPDGAAAARHEVVQVSARYRDPGSVDTHKWVIHWGDRSSSRAYTRERRSGTGAFVGTHSYDRAGPHNVRVTILDSHGASDSVTHLLQVFSGLPCAKVAGAGRMPGHPSSRFSLWAQCGASKAIGGVRLWLPGLGQYRSAHLTLLRGNGRSATLAGIGAWRAAGESTWHPRYRYVIWVLARHGRDHMNATVRTARGDVVFHLHGLIEGGHINVRRQ